MESETIEGISEHQVMENTKDLLSNDVHIIAENEASDVLQFSRVNGEADGSGQTRSINMSNKIYGNQNRNECVEMPFSQCGENVTVTGHKDLVKNEAEENLPREIIRTEIAEDKVESDCVPLHNELFTPAPVKKSSQVGAEGGTIVTENTSQGDGEKVQNQDQEKSDMSDQDFQKTLSLEEPSETKKEGTVNSNKDIRDTEDEPSYQDEKGRGDAVKLEALSAIEEEGEWLDILGSGQLKKKVIKKGKPNTRPQRMDICTVSLSGKLENGNTVDVAEKFVFQLGDSEVIQGLDLAIPLMEVEEVAEVEILPRFAYGKLGRAPDIPSNAKIMYTVQLLEFYEEKDIESLTVTERSKIGNKKREKGNWWYNREEYSLAVQCYRRAIEYLDDINENSDETNNEELQELLEDRMKVYNNMAAAQMKIEAYEVALKSLENVLRCQPNNVKAIFRKGKILAAQGKTEEAIIQLRRANKLGPETKVIHLELSKLLARQKKETLNARSMYRRMLGQSKSEKGSKRRSKFLHLPFGMIVGSVAAVVVGVMLYRYR